MPIEPEFASSYFKRLGSSIVAPATASGGPVGVLRISGKDLHFLSPLIGKFPEASSFRYSPLRIRISEDESFEIDRAVILYFQSPASFTGEDVVEIQCHGVASVLSAVENECLKLGALKALPGEFSFRAVLNEKMSLEEAESLQTAFASEGLGPYWAAKLLGVRKAGADGVELRLANTRQTLSAARGRIEAAIDFPESEAEQSSEVDSALEKLNTAQTELATLLTSFSLFATQSREPLVALVGVPNSGKSTLLNILCGGERALVSSTAGTTRDVIEARIQLKNRRTVRIIDTAGLRSAPTGSVEASGIQLGLDAAENASVLIWVQNATETEDERWSKLIRDFGRPVIRIHSHGDIVRSSAHFDFIREADKVCEWLLCAIEVSLEKLSGSGAATAVISSRQGLLLEEVRTELREAESCLRQLKPIELAGEHVRSAEELISKALGQNLSQDYINQIFSQFCLGK